MTNEKAAIIIGNIPINGDECYTIDEYQEAKKIAIETLLNNTAKWVVKKGMIVCSNCNHHDSVGASNFCPNCGRKME